FTGSVLLRAQRMGGVHSGLRVLLKDTMVVSGECVHRRLVTSVQINPVNGLHQNPFPFTP
uniref:Uncharacterized protein n=1 Tax=Denticeps clupeoides TaxID=299321 RepID=A0AAY4ER74_9TELE